MIVTNYKWYLSTGLSQTDDSLAMNILKTNKETFRYKEDKEYHERMHKMSVKSRTVTLHFFFTLTVSCFLDFGFNL